MAAADWFNDLAFRARNRLRWSAPARSRPAGTFAPLNARLTPAGRARADELRRRYDLARWPQLLTARQLQENLYVLDVLDQRGVNQHGVVGAAGAHGLDIGAKDGSTLPARVAAGPPAWDQIELDAHRRYADLSTRRAHAEKLAAAFPGCRYLTGSVTELTGTYQVITWILPFVRLGPLRAWGLPARCFEPSRLLRHVVGLCAPGGRLLVVNQGPEERDLQHALFADAGIAIDAAPVESALSPFRLPRFLFSWRRPSG